MARSRQIDAKWSHRCEVLILQNCWRLHNVSCRAFQSRPKHRFRRRSRFGEVNVTLSGTDTARPRVTSSSNQLGCKTIVRVFPNRSLIFRLYTSCVRPGLSRASHASYRPTEIRGALDCRDCPLIGGSIGFLQSSRPWRRYLRGV